MRGPACDPVQLGHQRPQPFADDLALEPAGQLSFVTPDVLVQVVQVGPGHAAGEERPEQGAVAKVERSKAWCAARIARSDSPRRTITAINASSPSVVPGTSVAMTESLRRTTA